MPHQTCWCLPNYLMMDSKHFTNGVDVTLLLHPFSLDFFLVYHVWNWIGTWSPDRKLWNTCGTSVLTLFFFFFFLVCFLFFLVSGNSPLLLIKTSTLVTKGYQVWFFIDVSPLLSESFIATLILQDFSKRIQSATFLFKSRRKEK